MIVKVYLSCCGGDKVVDVVNEAIRLAGVDAQVETVSDFVAAAKDGVMSTPAIKVDNKVVVSGRVPKLEDLVKFFDIPQFTKYGSWQGDYDIVDFVKSIERMEKEEGLILNPDFQRGNVWTEDQQIKFVEFILKGGNTARVVYLNHPNWTYRHKNNPYKEFVCVDGLQRITAMKRFIISFIVFTSYSLSMPYVESLSKPSSNTLLFLEPLSTSAINDMPKRSFILSMQENIFWASSVTSTSSISSLQLLQLPQLSAAFSSPKYSSIYFLRHFEVWQ
jgi:hypothetical protein